MGEAYEEPKVLSFAGSSRGVRVDLSAGIWTYDVIRIMPLGDSITAGAGGWEQGGYRGPLWYSLTPSGLPVDFVGSEQYGAPLPDNDHMGFSGLMADQLIGPVAGYVTTYRPDVVLLLAGTNDIQFGGLESLQSEILQVISNIAAASPSTKVIVSTLPPIKTGENGSDLVGAANEKIRAAVVQAASSGHKVALVEPALTQADLYDVDHPNETGYAKLAQVWSDAILATFATAPYTSVTGSEAADTLIGNATSNLLRGRGGNDDVWGLGGNDRLYGDQGDDRLYGGDGNDVAIGGSGADRLVGGDGSDKLYGGSDNDIVYGQDGSDRLYGDSGDDRLYGGLSGDLLYGGSGNDRLFGEADADTLYGGSGNDRLDGGAGNDILRGDAGRDILKGGAGYDRFVFASPSHSRGAATDVITDFQRRDKIDLSRIDADATRSGNQAFQFVSDFTGVAGQLQWDRTSSGFTVSGDVNGDAQADFEISVKTQLSSLRSTDFVL